MMRPRFLSQNCPLGTLSIIGTEVGVQASVLTDTPDEGYAELMSASPHVEFGETDPQLRSWALLIRDFLEGKVSHLDIPIDLNSGSPFQRRVWSSLLEIPMGETRSYTAIAQGIDMPSAVRAVATACGANPICILIPCHRVLPKGSNHPGGYRWGAWRKSQLLTIEGIHVTPARAQLMKRSA